jgi:hypothetical protein
MSMICLGVLEASIPLATEAALLPAHLHIYYSSKQLGTLQTGKISVDPTGRSHDLSIQGSARIIDTSLFTEMGIALFSDPEANISLLGEVHLLAKVFGINWQLTTLLNKTFNIQGLGGNLSANVDNFDIEVLSSGLLRAKIQATLPNPSRIMISPLGDLHLDFSYQDATLGRALAPHVSLLPGNNTLDLQCILNPPPEYIPLLNDLLSNYLMGVPSLLSASNGNSSIALFDDVVNAITLSTDLVVPKVPIAQAVLMTIDRKVWEELWKNHTVEIPLTLRMLNPFNATLYLTGANAVVQYGYTTVGTVITTKDRDNQPLHCAINPSSITLLDCLIPGILSTQGGEPELLDVLKAIEQELQTGKTYLNVAGLVYFTAGNLQLIANLNETHIPVCQHSNTQPCFNNT